MYLATSLQTLAGERRHDDHDCMTHVSDDVQILQVDEVEPVEVVPGVVRRRLPATERARGWMYDFAPGTEWPEVDVHEGEERYYVVSGEFIDRGHRLGPGSYVVFAPGSTHRPRTETGARMIGISIVAM
ncbi:cupin domain-containing protein [Micromonospora sp. NPDC005413]|uniref:cupin domain-containing protein n=1 Tax=Micromonospora sp. NPDC005413 TaxID=3154563 RepID=UPI0033BF9F92